MKMHFTIFCSVLEQNALSSTGSSNKDVVGKQDCCGVLTALGFYPPGYDIISVDIEGQKTLKDKSEILILLYGR